MQEQPIEVGDDHDKNWVFLKQFRDIHQHDKNISNQRFHLRDETDWQSIFSPLERSERRNNQIINRTYLDRKVTVSGIQGLSRSLLYRNSTSQQPFVDIKKECYRDRHPECEIQQRMTFAMTPRAHSLTGSKAADAHNHSKRKTIQYQSVQCGKTYQHDMDVARNLEDCITERKSVILERTIKHHPKVRSNKMSSTGSTFRRTATTFHSGLSEPKMKMNSSAFAIDPVVADEFDLRKHTNSKMYFKDVETIANAPQNHQSARAKQVLYGCNLYRYRAVD